MTIRDHVYIIAHIQKLPTLSLKHVSMCSPTEVVYPSVFRILWSDTSWVLATHTLIQYCWHWGR